MKNQLVVYPEFSLINPWFNILGQGLVLQFCVSDGLPVQSAPPCSGVGFVQVCGLFTFLWCAIVTLGDRY